jgi:hypothetical protein
VVKEGVMWMTIAVGWKTYFIVRVKGMKMSGVDEFIMRRRRNRVTWVATNAKLRV